ncbi:hypothetical protein L1987_19191 [Smallanthus sonchifolius]|uniref:Uncharacterized protein n=1 Tax=Smallanthus sonchifolius TaxID=185202 RepID=A0ACB9IQ38_9ASTR|nr:hypothetical protein L1987_19191 [Smallanthus sonchifolius]
MPEQRIRSTGLKDRHSKVYTAKGPRDRRLRLSALTAIQFYDVQDRLGYDRPSKAVDWLINKAKASIDQLPPIVNLHYRNLKLDNHVVDNHMGISTFLPASRTSSLQSVEGTSTYFDASGGFGFNPPLVGKPTTSQLLNYISQRGTLQSNISPAWVQALPFHHPSSSMPGFHIQGKLAAFP